MDFSFNRGLCGEWIHICPFCPQTKFWLNFSPREILSGYNIVKWVSHIIGDCVEGGGVIHLVAHAVGGNVILPKSV